MTAIDTSSATERTMNLVIKHLLIASTIVLAGYASWTVTDVRAPAIEMAR